MKKVTYTNSVNGLSMEFSSNSPEMHLDLGEFDGCSVGATAITYKPVELDGQRFISSSLNARTINLPVEFTAKSDGRYSRTGALAVWEKLLNTFVPLHEGWLVWTNGTESRRIRCRTAETPQLTQKLPYLFSASISLIADYPFWESTSEHSLAVAASAAAVTVKNSCGIAVPLCIDVPSGAPSLLSTTAPPAAEFPSRSRRSSPAPWTPGNAPSPWRTVPTRTTCSTWTASSSGCSPGITSSRSSAWAVGIPR